MRERKTVGDLMTAEYARRGGGGGGQWISEGAFLWSKSKSGF